MSATVLHQARKSGGAHWYNVPEAWLVTMRAQGYEIRELADKADLASGQAALINALQLARLSMVCDLPAAPEDVATIDAALAMAGAP